MRLVPLIAVLSGCSGASTAQKPVVEPPVVPAETLWDRGTFITVDKAAILPDTEENFEIYRTGEGYKFVVKYKRPAPTGELSDGEVTLFTDAKLSPLQGNMISTIHMPGRDEITKSSIQREPDGRLTTQIVAADGKTETAASKQPNDWYIGGTITTFLVALCQADAGISAPVVYPDKATSLGPHKPLPIEGSDREVTSRILVYEQSRRQVIAACEAGKLAGEVARGTTIVRTGDLALARVLEQWYR
ncbi:MAG TPA: hypothetical protein VIV11_18455 [Kofleriaceae bacterium]